MTAELKIRTPAKINLSLRILGRLKNGYHEIETVFQAIGLWDEITIMADQSHEIKLKVAGEDIPEDSRNLCYQAAELFASEVSSFSGCNINLKKRIPVGAGLGGGSSDAAATLLGLNQLFGFPLSRQKLHNLAAQLGADVPFFLQPGLAIGRQKGDRLEPLDLSWDFWILLICPDIKISTSWAYSNLKIGLTKDKKNIILKSQIGTDIQLDVFYKFFANNFETLVFSTYPELGEIKMKLLQCGAQFGSLSGTGAAVYGLFKNREEAQAAELRFREKAKTYIIKPINTHSH